jgi:sulfur-carrier protein
MAVQVKIPALYRKYTGGNKIINEEPDTVGNILDEIIKRYPGLKKKFLNKNGGLSSNINLMLNERLLNIPDGLKVHAADKDILSILVFISGD